MADYYAQAEQQTQAEHNKKVQNLKSQLASNQLALDQQKTGINQNYDYQVAQQNLQNKLNKNSVSNAMIGRGLGNSSIAVSGLAEQDAKNTRLVGDINRNRTSDLNNIDAQKALLDRNYNAEVGQLEADRLSEIRTLAYQLEDRAFDKDYKNNPNIKWNFTKFLVNRDGEVVGRFEPTANMKSVEEAIAALI